jgi:hypothetical protein
MTTVDGLLLILAFVCFVLAALQVPSPRVNLTALGLVFYAGSLLL